MLNIDNFLRFSGAVRNTPIEVVAVDDGPVTFDVSDIYLDIDVLDNDTSTYPAESVEIVSYSSGFNKVPKVVNNMLRVYKPASGVSFSISYRFYDVLGNRSNIAVLYLNRAARATSFIGYAPSYACIKTSGGQNTGQAAYGQLKEIYDDNSTEVLPLNLVPNIISHPDYIAPVTNTGLCPIPGQLYAAFQIINSTTTAGNPYFTISKLTIIRTGFPDIVHNVNVPPGASLVVNVPAGAMNQFSFEMSSIFGNPFGRAMLLQLFPTTGTVNIPLTINGNPTFTISLTSFPNGGGRLGI